MQSANFNFDFMTFNKAYIVSGVKLYFVGYTGLKLDQYCFVNKNKGAGFRVTIHSQDELRRIGIQG